MVEPAANIAEFTVSEISAAVKRTVEDAFGYVRVRGEISGYRGPHSSGHAYFSLKDERARLEAVVWRGTFGKLRFKPEEGLEVVATELGCIGRVGDGAAPTVDRDAARVGRHEPDQHLHQGALAGTVLAEDPMDAAPLQRQFDVTARDDGSESLGDATQLDGRGGGGCAPTGPASVS
jgi:hypothetical protein